MNWRERFSYHESGHLCCAVLHYNCAPTNVEMLVDEEGIQRGHARYNSAAVYDLIKSACAASFDECHCDRLRYAMDLVITLAGPIAEAKWTETSEDAISNKDAEEIRENSDKISAEHSDEVIKLASVLANELVERHWWKITVLARALLKNGRIVEKEEIQRLLGKPSNPEIAMSDLAFLIKKFAPNKELTL